MRDSEFEIRIEFTHKANASAHDASLVKLRDEILAGLDLDELLEPNTGNGHELVVYNPAEGGSTDRGVK